MSLQQNIPKRFSLGTPHTCFIAAGHLSGYLSCDWKTMGLNFDSPLFDTNTWRLLLDIQLGTGRTPATSTSASGGTWYCMWRGFVCQSVSVNQLMSTLNRSPCNCAVYNQASALSVYHCADACYSEYGSSFSIFSPPPLFLGGGVGGYASKVTSSFFFFFLLLVF